MTDQKNLKPYMVDNNLVRPDRYMFRETLKTEEGKTTLPKENVKPKKRKPVKGFDTEVYTRVGNTMSRNQDILRNTVHNVTTLYGMRDLMASNKRNPEEKLTDAINLERKQAHFADKQMTNKYLDVQPLLSERNTNPQKPIITTFVTTAGTEVDEHLKTVIDTLGLTHLKPHFHRGKKHGDAGLPIGQKQF
jgi:hypothetical protein